MKNISFFKIFTVLCLSLIFMTSHARAGFISEITEMAFQKVVLESDEPIIIWFYSGISGGKLENDIDKYVQKKSMVKLVKMDRSLNIVTVSKYKIKKNNTFVFFADGEELSRTSAIASVDDLEEFTLYNMEEYMRRLQEQNHKEWSPSRIKDNKDKATEPDSGNKDRADKKTFNKGDDDN